MIIAIRLTMQSKHLADESPLLSKKLLVIAYSIIFIMISFSVFTALGLMSGTEFTLHVRMAHGLVSGVLMLFLLQIRYKHIERLQHMKLFQLSLKEQVVDAERQQQEEKSNFLAMLAHDLKTPLAVVKMVLGNKQITTKEINHVNRAVNDMTSVIERCLQVAELEGNKIPINFVNVDIAKELHDLQCQSIGATRTHLEIDAPLMVRTDAQLLRIILANLLDNATKYSLAESPIQLLVKQTSNPLASGIEISVLNLPGKAGWPDPDKLFQKYYRSQHSKHLTGSGQGLYLASQLALTLGGQIRYAPTATQICFILCLPN